jgi:hypothetical protein
VEVVHKSDERTASFYPDFDKIAKLIREETKTNPILLPVSSKILQERFERGDSVVLGVNGQTVGHLSFTRLLDSNVKHKLGLKPNFPEVVEVGSAIVAYQLKIKDNRDAPILLRNRGYSEKMLTSLLHNHLEDLQDRSVNPIVGIGTTKSLYFVKAISHISDHQNLNIKFVEHSEYPFIAPLTCVCTPGKGGGMGYQYDGSCPVRIDSVEVLETFNGRAVTVRGEAKCACVMFVLNPILAESVNNGLSMLVNGASQEEKVKNFVNLLRDNKYYPIRA